MADLATLQTRLAEAEDALHKLMTGGKTVAIRSSNGSMVTYGEADAAALRGYIADLRGQIGSAQGGTGRRKPIYATF